VSVAQQHCPWICAGFLEDHTSFEGEGKPESERI